MEHEKKLRKIHACSFVKYIPSGIHRFSKFNKYCRNRLALSRNDGSVEIWIYLRENNLWQNECIIPGKEDYSVEALVWSPRGGLIVAGTDAQLTEWDIFSLKPTISVSTHGGSILCMDFHIKNNVIIAGCNKGNVALYSTETSLEYLKTICKIEDMIISIAWHEEGKFFVLGTSCGNIHLFNFQTLQFISQIKTDSSHSVPWCMLFLKNFNLVLGDSEGNVQIWDIKCSSLIQTFKSHKADTLSLCTDSAENIIISCSVDKTVAVLSKNVENNSWTYSQTFHSHKNDVTCLTFDENKNEFLSGGVDGMCFHYQIDHQYTIHLLTKFGFFPQLNHIKHSKNSKRLLFFDDLALHLWQLPTDSQDSVIKLIELKTHSGQNITDISISENGDYFSYSTSAQSHIYSSNFTESSIKSNSFLVKEVKLKDPTTQLHPYNASAFSNSSQFYAILSTENDVIIYDLLNLCCIFSYAITLIINEDYINGISQLIFAENDETLVIHSASSYQQFQVINLKDLTIHSLPSLCSIPMCANILGSTMLVVATISSKILMFDLTSFELCFELNLSFPQEFAKYCPSRTRYLGLFFDSKPNVLMYCNYCLVKVSLKKILKALRNKDNSEILNKKFKRLLVKPLPVSVCTEYKSIIFSSIFNDGSLVMVERKPKDILSCQKPSLYLKKFYKT